MTAALQKDLSYHSLADEFLRLYRSRRIRSVEQFAAMYPEMATVIVAEFPAILWAETLNNPQPQASEQVPTKIGPYEIRSEIGRGGMGRVFAGWHAELERDVAIKVLAFKGPDWRRATERFRLEARAGAMLNHSNIVQVYDHGTHENLVYLVMNRIKGICLGRMVEGLEAESARLQGAPMTLDWCFIANIGAQVASALSYAHEQGVVHRDIKPGNLLIDDHGKVWVTDFGLVKLMEGNLNISQTGDIIGTPRYMAPEQCRGVCDARSDIYGLGLTLYELACGKKVWESVSQAKLIKERSTLELPSLHEVNSAIPPALTDIIMKACELRPEDRYQTAKELHYVLTRFAHGHNVGDRRRRSGNTRSKVRRRSIVATASVASVIAVAGLCYGVYYFTLKKDPFRDPVAAMKVLKDDNLRTEFVKELPSIIKEMISNDSPEFRETIGDVAEEALHKSLEQYEIPETDKERLQKNVSTWVENYKKGELLGPDGETVATSMSDTGMAQVTKLQRLLPVVEKSGLSAAERQMARQLLNTISHGILSRQLSNASSGALIDLMDGLNRVSQGDVPANGSPISLHDEDLRQIFTEMRHMAESSHLQQVTPQMQLDPRVVKTIDEAVRTPKGQELIRRMQRNKMWPLVPLPEKSPLQNVKQ